MQMNFPFQAGINNPDKKYSPLEDDKLPKIDSFGMLDSSALVNKLSSFKIFFVVCPMFI